MTIAGYSARAVHRQMRSLSGIGMMLGTLFFAAALTPSLIPRSYLMQGVLAGICFAIGYGFGCFLRWLWHYLELREPGLRTRLLANRLAAILCLAIAVLALWRVAGWQNAIRRVMDMEPVTNVYPFKVCAVAVATFAVTLVLGRGFAQIARSAADLARRLVPRRIANAVGLVLAALLFWSLANDVLARSVFRMLDSSYREFDALLEPERPRPTDPGKTGSDASLLKWGELGRAGREFIASGPTASDIRAVSGQPAKEPVRVYVGLRSAATTAERARLALEELKRTGGFGRSVLVVITPTGTGWVDPAALDSIEYLHHGDVASVAVQYSYLSSPLSLLVQPEYGADAARALFLEIYGYWTTLPRNARPKLYLFGLSLGAMNSEKSAELFEMIGDPINGALWSGPPFESRIWRSITEARNPGSPQWLPEFRDGRFVRFMNQHGSPVPPETPWGPMRVVYLQYASDPIAFFDYRDLYRRPSWMNPPLGPDVSPELQWYPVVTMLQLALDMAVATSTPIGYGHVYAPQHYVDGWIAVTDVHDWSADAVTALKRHLAKASREDRAGGSADPYSDRGG